jgi:hypothetical protein
MADQMRFQVTREQVEAARAKLAEAGFPFQGSPGLSRRTDTGSGTHQLLASCAWRR